VNAARSPLHAWDVTPGEARTIQERLRHRIITRDRFGPVRHVAGVDVGFPDRGRHARAAVVVLAFPTLEPVETCIATLPVSFPYVPGLLSFRELPVVLQAFGQLQKMPDLILCDGQGYAHPRRFGLACHLGLWLDLPAIGVGKTRLIGSHEAVPHGKGEWRALVEGDEIIGAVLRTRSGVKPVYVSSGHRVGLNSAIRLVLACTTRYRLPETTRHAHRLASTCAAPPADGWR